MSKVVHSMETFLGSISSVTCGNCCRDPRSLDAKVESWEDPNKVLYGPMMIYWLGSTTDGHFEWRCLECIKDEIDYV